MVISQVPMVGASTIVCIRRQELVISQIHFKGFCSLAAFNSGETCLISLVYNPTGRAHAVVSARKSRIRRTFLIPARPSDTPAATLE